MNNEEWLNDPALSHISKEKIKLISDILQKGSNITQKEMMPFLITMSKTCKEQNISFQRGEIELILAVMKKHGSKEEIEKINKVSKLL